MFDDSMIDFMVRMQGRKVSVKMDQKVAEIGHIKPTAPEISRTKATRLESFRRDYRARVNAENDFIRYDFISFRDFDEEPRGNVESFIAMSSYPNDIARAAFNGAWLDTRRIPVDAFGEAEGVPIRNEIGQWLGVRTLNAADKRIIRDNFADRMRTGSARLLKLDKENGSWKALTTRSTAYQGFITKFIERPENIQLEHRSFITSHQMSIDLKLLASHWLKAEEHLWETWENTVSWASWSWSEEPSFNWIEWTEAMGDTPPFKQLRIADHMYKRITQTANNGLRKYVWIPHPLTGTMPNPWSEKYDGEWFTYDIPFSDVQKDDIDIVKDFNNFLLERLVRK